MTNNGYNVHYLGENRVVCTENLKIKYTVHYRTIAERKLRILEPTVRVGAGLAGYKA